jgi:hypothetical protein
LKLGQRRGKLLKARQLRMQSQPPLDFIGKGLLGFSNYRVIGIYCDL